MNLAAMLPGPVRSAIRAARFKYLNSGFRPYVADFERDGHPFRFYVGDFFGEKWFKEGWDWTEIGFLKSNIIGPGDVVLDCGAHHGELMLFMSKWVGDNGRVIAFDPVPLNAFICNTQIAINFMKNAEFHHAAVGKERGTIKVTSESNAQISSSGVEVQCVRIDDFSDRKPTVLKIDVEGFEAEVLKGATEVLKTRPKLAIEVHTPSLSRYGTSFDEVMSLANFAAYKWTRQYSGTTDIAPWHGEKLDNRIVHMFGVPS